MMGIEAVRRFLETYNENFGVALLLWPAFSFLLTLPILAMLYHRDGAIRATSAVGAYLSVLYGLALVCFTLYPLPMGDVGLGFTYGVEPNFNPLAFVGDIAHDGLEAVFHILFNGAFFVPLGFIAGRGLRWGVLPSVVLGFAVSLLIEVAQLTGLFGVYPYAYRMFDVDDLLWNTSGALIGWLLARATGKSADERSKDAATPFTRDPGFVRRCVALWLDMLIVGLVALVPWTLLWTAWHALGVEPLQLFGMRPGQTTLLAVGLLALAAFLVVEVLVPWIDGGSTPGGAFTRMTFETRERTGGKRVLFYAVRTITIMLAFMFPWPIMMFVLLFFLIARCMPYDLLP